MNELRYIVSQFINDDFVYSIHCGSDALDEVVRRAKENGYSVKVSAFYVDNEKKEV